MADALGRAVTMSAVREASLRGAAVIALGRIGIEAELAPLGPVVRPRPGKEEAFREARERQRRLYEVVTSEPTS
jgi:sugar (pentulose or hexulose) kinase